jgi:integrase
MGRKATNVAPFNDLAVKRIIKEAAGKAQQEWRFEGIQRLVLVTRPTGLATFYVFYVNRHKDRRKLRLGDYDPDHFPLTKARSAALERIAAIDQGADPVGDIEAKGKEITFKALAEKCLAEHPDLADTTRTGYRYALERDAYPKIGHLPASDVTADHIVDICKAIEAKGARVQADRSKAAIGGVYRWAIKQRLARSNPTMGLGRRASNIARTRTPTAVEIAALWDAAEKRIRDPGRGNGPPRLRKDGEPYKVGQHHKAAQSVGLIVQLAIVTGQRRTEVAGARLSELQGLDTDSPVWVISGDVNKRGKIIQGRTKNGREQRLPLSWQAVQLFRQAIAIRDERAALDEAKGYQDAPSVAGDWIFPADVNRQRGGKVPRTFHINGESVTRALIELRSSLEVEGGDVSDVSLHDFRRAISNWLKNEGVPREVRDLVLNHLDPSVTERHYSQEARMEKQVRDALQAWADHVWRVTGQAKPADNVVQLLARA